MYLPDVRFLRLPRSATKNALADILWFRTIDYFGKHFRGDRLYPWLARMCDAVTELDPRAVHVYSFAGFILTWEAQNPDDGIRLLEKGVAQFPDSWQLHYYLGFSRFYFKNDLEGAVPHLRRAAELPGTHPYVTRLAAMLYSQQYGTGMAREFLEELRDSGGAGGMESVIGERLKDVEFSEDVARLRGRCAALPRALRSRARRAAGADHAPASSPHCRQSPSATPTSTIPPPAVHSSSGAGRCASTTACAASRCVPDRPTETESWAHSCTSRTSARTPQRQWTFRAFRAVSDINLSLREGEIFGLIGHNGAGGTTTTFKLLLGFLRPTRGRSLLLDRPSASTWARRQIGFLPEQAYFYDHLSVRETLEFYAGLYGLRGAERSARVNELAGRLALTHKLAAPVRSLSKGNLQRVGIAQSIIHRPRLVILDEPMSAQPGAQGHARSDSSLKRDASTVIFVAHPARRGSAL